MIEFNSVFSEHFDPAPLWPICYGAAKSMANDSKKRCQLEPAKRF